MKKQRPFWAIVEGDGDLLADPDNNQLLTFDTRREAREANAKYRSNGEFFKIRKADIHIRRERV